MLLAGLGIGALGASALIQFAPHPLRLTFVVLLFAFAIEAVALWLTPETAPGKSSLLASFRPHVAVPAQARAAFALMTPLNVANWSLGGFYLSLVPAVVTAATGSRTPLTGGIVVASLMFAGAVTVYLRRTKDPRSSLATSVFIAGVGVTTIVFGVHLAMVPLLVAGTLISGIAFGLNLLGCVGSIMPLAKADERAGLLAAFYTF